MPTYTYQCSQCGKRFERVLSISRRKEPETENCEKCGSSNSIQQIIVSNFELMAPDQLGRIKPPEDWRTFLSDLKRRNPGSDFTTY